MLRFAKVKFPNSDKLYDYICELDDIKKADKVYVSTREGAKIVDVCGIFYADLSEMPLSAYRYKKVWGKVPERIQVKEPKQSFEVQATKRVEVEKPKQSFGPLGKKKKVQKAAPAEAAASVSPNAETEDKPEQAADTYANSYDEIIKEEEKKLMIKEILIMLVINAVFLFLYRFSGVFK